MIAKRTRCRRSRLNSEMGFRYWLERTPSTGGPRTLSINSSILFDKADQTIIGSNFSNSELRFRKYVRLARFVAPSPVRRPILVIGSRVSELEVTGPAVLQALVPSDQSTETDDDTLSVPRYFFLYNKNKKETSAANPSEPPRIIGGELVLVTGRDPENEFVMEFRDPVTQDYPSDSGNLLSNLPSGVEVTTNLKVTGLRIQGKNRLGFGAWVTFGWVDGLTVVNCHGHEGTQVGFGFQFCRDVRISRCSGRHLPKLDPPDESEPWGYTFQINRSVEVDIEACIAENAQYALTVEGGSAAVRANNLYYFGSGDRTDQTCFDIHGGEAFNIQVRLAVSPNSGISLGNTSWRRGAADVIISKCFATRLRITSGLHDLAVNDCSFQNVKFEYTSQDPNPGSWNSNPIDVSFAGCTIDIPDSHPDAYAVSLPVNGAVNQSSYEIDNLSFTECTITNQGNTAVLFVGANTKDSSSISFDSCTLTLPGSSAANDAIIIQTDSQSPSPLSLSLTVSDTVFLMANNQDIARGSNATTTTKFFDSGVNLRGPAMNNLRDICKNDVTGMDNSTLPNC